MKTATRPRFDLDALRKVAGEKVFKRGEEYQRGGVVEIVAIDQARVVANVAGTEDYRTELAGRGTTIRGACSCPAFSDWGFCKHMVATALAANAAGGEAEREGEERLLRIREHLRAKGIDGVVDLVMDLAARDSDLLQILDLRSAGAQADDRTIEARLGKAIEQATRVGDHVGYREASAWADRIVVALRAVADLVPAGRVGPALRLALRAVDLIEEAAPSIDDSNGTCGELMHQAREIHLAAARAGRPEAVGFARELFAREMRDEYDVFADCARHYAEILGETGLAEYRRLALEAWEAADAATRNRQSSRAVGDDYRLRQILDFFAEREGDLDARIALRARHLPSPYSYLDLARFCLEHGREEEALRRAEEGLWVFEDGRQDTRLVLFVVERLSKAGRDQEAEAHLWRAFEAMPALDIYLRLRPLTGEAACDRALACIDSHQARAKNGPLRRPLAGLVRDLAIRMLIHESRFDRAWEMDRRQPASAGIREELARASEATHGEEAVAVYRARVEDLAQSGGDEAYRRAAELVNRMATLRAKADHGSYVAALKDRFRRRRNLIKLLP